MLQDSLDIKKVFWDKSWKIPGVPWNICGYSRSAFRTGFYIKELDMLLDAGPQNFRRPNNILITHTHGDHIAALPFTLIGDADDNGEMSIVQIYGPADAEPFVINYINTLFSTNAMREPRPSEETNMWYHYNGVLPQQIFELIVGKTKLDIEVFHCDHQIPTVSYGISEIKDKLLPEYATLSGKEIATLRKNGIEITHSVHTKRLAYVCDTSIDVLKTNPTILSYPVVFIECTFILPGEEDIATSKKHIHWEQLKPYTLAHPEITFMLFHFSQRYKDADIRAFFETINQPNVKCWA